MIMSYLAKIEMSSFKPTIILFLKGGYYGRKGHYHNDPEGIKRLHIIKQVLEKKLKQIEAAKILDLSSRQIRRIVKRIREEGEKGIIHRLRGQPSHRRLPRQIENKVIALYRKKYQGFGPTLASEKLLEIDKIKISDETLRLWLIEKGEW